MDARWDLAIFTIVVGHLLMSGAAYTAFWIDKRRARRSVRRIRERTLLALAALGGWPGAVAAQRLLRHKSRDARFRIQLLAIIALHAVGWAACLWLLVGAR